MRKEVMQSMVDKALSDILERALQPERFNQRTGWRMSPASLRCNPSDAGAPLSAPRYRLALRLELLCALAQFKVDLMKEILTDKEAIADAKTHNKDEALSLLDEVQGEGR